jgi:hypothetical protein
MGHWNNELTFFKGLPVCVRKHKGMRMTRVWSGVGQANDLDENSFS